MIQITIPDAEVFDEKTNTFKKLKGQTLTLEHSLVSLSKWESRWEKPFLSNDYEKTDEEVRDYIKCMTITQNVNPNIYDNLSRENINEIYKYIDAKMTATTISEKNASRRGSMKKDILTSEIIYFQMIALNVPFECQKWHLNRLITLLRVCAIKQEGSDNKTRRMTAEERRAMNMAQRKKFKSKG